MEEVVPGECLASALQVDEQSWSALSRDVVQAHEEWRPVEGPMEEDVEEADAEMDVGEVPPTGGSVPEQVPAPPATMLAMAGIWAGGPSGQVAEPVVSSRARGNAPATQAE